MDSPRNNQKIVAIAAMAQNRVIGVDNKIPWRIKEEMAFFKQTTTGHVVVMGRKTWDSFPKKPLPNRDNYILSRTKSGIEDGGTFIQYISQIPPSDKTIFVCGGAEIYKENRFLFDELLLTVVNQPYVGDTTFPILERNFNQIDKVLAHELFTTYRYSNPGNKVSAREFAKLEDYLKNDLYD